MMGLPGQLVLLATLADEVFHASHWCKRRSRGNGRRGDPRLRQRRLGGIGNADRLRGLENAWPAVGAVFVVSLGGRRKAGSARDDERHGDRGGARQRSNSVIVRHDWYSLAEFCW